MIRRDTVEKCGVLCDYAVYEIPRSRAVLIFNCIKEIDSDIKIRLKNSVNRITIVINKLKLCHHSNIASIHRTITLCRDIILINE